MSYTFTPDPYVLLNIGSACLTVFVLIGVVVWLTRFSMSAIEHRDRVGLFLMTLAILLFMVNAIALTIQIGQALGLTEHRIVFAFFRFVERIFSVVGVVLLFVFGKQRYE